jgi:hypothetical protein
VLLLVAGGSTMSAPAPKVLSSERVRAALEWGRTAGEDELKQYELKTTDTWSVDFDTPFLRVAQLSAAVARRGKVLVERDVPDRSSSEEWHVYLHARQPDGAPTTLPNFEYVMLLRPVGEGRSESVLPTTVDRFVRQVPIPGYFGPARVAQSVRASFPAGSLVAGGELRVVLHGGRVESIPLDAELLSRVK